MDSIGDLNLNWACGYQGTPLRFIDQDTIVYCSGNTLNFIRTNGSHFKSIPSHGKGIGPFAVSPESKTVAYTEASLEPLIYVLSYPQLSIVHALKGDAKMEYKCLAFSGNGQKLVSLSGIPDFLLTIWDLNEGLPLCQNNIDKNGMSYVSLSFNPLNWRQLFLLKEDRLVLWTLESCDTQTLLTSVEVELPEKTTPVGTTIQHQRLAGDAPGTSRGSSGPLDMSNVLYNFTYDDRVRKYYPVIPVSHCWTSNGSNVFVGFHGGQVMSIEFETGTIKVLINPAEIQGEDAEINEEMESVDVPKTGHAVLTDGLVDCLKLTPQGLLTAGKDGQIYCFTITNEFGIADSYKLNHDITSLDYFSDSMIVGTKQGFAYKLDLNNFSQCLVLLEHHTSSFIGLDVISPGTEHCITCRESGLVQVWSMSDSRQLSSLHLQTNCTGLVCPLSSHTAIIGTHDGYLILVSLVSLETPRIVQKYKLYHDMIKTLKVDWYGRYIVTGSSSEKEKSIFVCSVKNGLIQVLGHTEATNAVQDISILPSSWESDSTTCIAVLTSPDNTSSMITLFYVPNMLADDQTKVNQGLFQDSTQLFSDSSILKLQLIFSLPLLTMLLAPNKSIFIVHGITKALCKLPLPKDNDTVTDISESDLNDRCAAHELPLSQYGLSFHQKWLISTGQDGKVFFRQTAKMTQSIVQCCPHHYKSKGGIKAVMSNNGQYILTIGDKETLTSWQWNLTAHGKLKMNEAIQYADTKTKHLYSVIENQNKVLLEIPEFEAKELPEQTWLELAIERAHKEEDEKYDELKKQLRLEINALREKVLSMIETNEQLNDIEKLERSEFILDTEEHQRHQKEEEEKIKALREEIELNNLAQMYLHHLIKKECWDAMKVKGKTVKGFQGRFEVANYPLKEISNSTITELNRIKTLRKVELAEKKLREKELANHMEITKPQLPTLELGLEEEEDVKKDEKESEPHTLLGSRAAEYGAPIELLYDQFELLTPVTKRNQIVLIQECIRCIKESFNKEFDEVWRQKGLELSRIQEKNVRIRKIANDLKLDEKIIEPSLDSDEQPERLLTVTDDEIQVEKYISVEERKRLEELAKEEEERKLREMGDNWRERGLDMMMAGRLEANAEEELFKDLPRPEFMSKDVSEMTEEEIRMKHEFEKKEAAWLEEREKMKKALEAEMKKHQESITQGMATFDEKIMKLFQLKVCTEKTVLQEELKIMRLIASLLVEEEVNRKDKIEESTLVEKRKEKAVLTKIIANTKRQIEAQQALYDQIMASDKELDRSFKKEFADCEPCVDQLYRLFRRRPRGHKLGELPTVKSSNPPGGPVPSSGSINTKTSGGMMVQSFGSSNWSVPDMMSELDSPTNIPEGLELAQWERFVVARHCKVESERQVKEVAMKLAEMNSFLKKREEEEQQIQTDIQEINMTISKIYEDKSVYEMNPEIQFLLKQGQVEIEASDFAPDFSNSVLIHRSGVEELNNQIKTLGEGKLAHMVECKDFKKGIRMLEWELKRLQMEAEDLINKAKDIQMLRVTKELQERLMTDNIQSKDQKQIETLEKTITLNEKIHQKRLRNFSKLLNSLKNDVDKKKLTNSELDTELEEMCVEVVERQNIKDLAGAPPAEESAEARMKDIVTRRKLVELAKTQAKEIKGLRDEVERLRMKTFPALVQVQNLI